MSSAIQCFVTRVLIPQRTLEVIVVWALVGMKAV